MATGNSATWQNANADAGRSHAGEAASEVGTSPSDAEAGSQHPGGPPAGAPQNADGSLPAASTATSGVTVDWLQALGEHERWLRSVVGARLGEPQAIDEVMQEVSLAAVAQKAPLQDAAKVAPWLYRLAVRQVLLYRRKQGRRRKLTDRYANEFQPTEGDGRQAEPLDWLLAEERATMIRKAMGRLAPRDAEILSLKYTEDWSYHELAAHLGVSHSAVEARLHRARQRLRDELVALSVIESDRG